MSNLHPSLFFPDGRRTTFVGKATLLSPQNLADAGFMWTEIGTQCVFCKGILGFWESHDSPLLEHVRNFPMCPFVRFKLGDSVSIQQLEAAFTKPMSYHSHSGPEKHVNKMASAKGYDTVW